MGKTITNQRETLKNYISIFKEWNSEMHPYNIVNTCIELEYLDQTQNKDLWKELKKAIETNKNLLDADMLEELTEPVTESNINKFWWYKMLYKMRDE